MAYTTPTRTRQHDASILTYELPSRVHSTCIYPLQAPNGSTVLLYARDAGISVLWRGGRALKPLAVDKLPAKPNGTSKHDASVMIIDSDDDEPNQDAATEHVEYEDEIDNPSVEQPDRIVAHTFVPIGVTPLHLAAPPLCRSQSARKVNYAPEYCSGNVVVAAACADGSVRLVAVSIVPTRYERQEPLENVRLYLDEQAFKAPEGVSLSVASRDYASYNLDSFADSSPATSRDEEWDLLVAWHVSVPVPAASIAQVPIETVKNQTRLGKPRHQTYYIPAPLQSLSFNPASRQLARQKQLLMADTEGLVRICELTFTAKTSASGTVYQELTRVPNWVATFYVPFATSQTRISGSTPSAVRKRILGAEWAVDGRCIIAIFGDGSWGLWDLEGVQPQFPGALYDTSNATGVNGGGVTQFSLRGNLATKSASSANVPERSNAARERSMSGKRLAPMTPNTRKATTYNFLDKAPSRGTELSRAFRGGISVSRLSEPSASAPYETVLFWFEDGIYVIPNIMLYWQRAIQSAAGGVTGRANTTAVVGPSPTCLSEVSTLGEAVSSLVQCPAYNDSALASLQKLQHDFVVAAEHRLIFYCPVKAQGEDMSNRHSSSAKAAQTSRLSGPSLESDEQLLARGELGLAGLDRMMEGMESSVTNSGLFAQAERPRRVGFAVGP